MAEWSTVLALGGAALSAGASVLAWLAKLRWGQEYAAAKDETIKAKQAQIEALELSLRELKELSPMRIREYSISVKEQLEEYNETLKAENERSGQVIEGLHLQLSERDQELLKTRELVEQIEHERRKLEGREQAFDAVEFLLGRLASELRALDSQFYALKSASAECPLCDAQITEAKRLELGRRLRDQRIEVMETLKTIGKR